MTWTWDEVVADSQLQDLPYKLELNRNGEVVMNAVRVIHALLVDEIQRVLIRSSREGRTPPEFPIQTSDGVRSPDLVWISDDRKNKTRNQSAAQLAPELCIEVMSPGNQFAHLQAKGLLYLEAGALEYWICEEQGRMHFFDQSGELNQSQLFPAFPQSISA
jgi:Uma2 family endonuclease